MENFDPDEYLRETQPDSGEFDPDKYLEETRDKSPLESGVHGAMQGATLGFMDELSGVGEAAGRAVGIKGIGGKLSDLEFDAPSFEFEKNYLEGRDKKRALHEGLKKENPDSYMAGELVGGAAAMLSPVVGAARGSAAAKGVISGAKALNAGATGLRSAIGTSAALSGLGAAGMSDADNLHDLSVDTLTGMALGGVTSGGIYGLGAGGKYLAGKAADNKLGRALGEMLKLNKKANAIEIEDAAKRLGTKPTPGMIYDSEFIQNAENRISQNPTIPGWLIRRRQGNIAEAAGKAAEDVLSDRTNLSAYEVGDKVKNIIKETTNKKFSPSIDTFKNLSEYTKNIPMTEASKSAVTRNIGKIREVELFPKSKAANIASGIQKALAKNPSADEIKSLRTMVGTELETADGIDKTGLLALYHKLARLEENTIKRGVISSARTKAEGETIAKGMLDQLKGAKKGYAEQMKNLKQFGSKVGLRGIDHPEGFATKIDAIQPENVPHKFFNLGLQDTLNATEKHFPDAAALLRKSRIGELHKGALSREGDVIPNRLLKATDDLALEAQEALFRDKASKLTDLRTVQGSIPGKVGASDTPRGMSWSEIVSLNQIKDFGNYAAYKGRSAESVQKLANFLLQKPAFRNMAEKNPKAFQAAVFKISEHMKPSDRLSKVASEEQAPNVAEQGDAPSVVSTPMSDEEARQSFLDK